MKVCKKCGKEMLDEVKFCTACGESMADEDTASATKGIAEEVESAEEATEKADLAKAEETEEAETVEEVVTEEAETVEEVVTAEAETAEEADSAEEVTEDSQEPVEAVQAESSVEVVADTAGETTTYPNVTEQMVEGYQMKKSGNGKKVGIIAGIIGLIAVVGVAASMMLIKKEDPKEVVIQAFKSVYEEETVNHLENIIGFSEIYERAIKENNEVNLSLKLADSSMSELAAFTGTGFDIQGKTDQEANKSIATIGIQFQDMDLLHLDGYLDDKEFMMAIPELSESVFTINYADDLQGQIENSPFLGEVFLESGIDFDAFGEYMEQVQNYDSDGKNTLFDLTALWDRYKTGSEAIENLKTAMTVEKGQKTTAIVDGEEAGCRSYETVISGPAFVEFFKTTSDFFLEDETLKKDMMEYFAQVLRLSEIMNPYGYSSYSDDPEDMQAELWNEAETSIDELLVILEELLQDDVNMTVTVDAKGRMASFKAETMLTSEDEKANLELTADFMGGDYLTQNVNAQLKLYDDITEVVFDVDKTESFDGNTLLSNIDVIVTYDGEEATANYAGSYQVDNGQFNMDLSVNTGSGILSFTMDGVVTELEKGNSMQASADSIRVAYDDEFIELSGTYGIKPMEGEVTVPEGTQMDIFAATEEEWTAVVVEFYMKGMELISKIQY
jgi:hypothetical protein